MEDVFKQKFFELQNLEKQLKQIKEEVLKVEDQIIELHKVVNILDETKSLHTGDEILVPVSNGIFIKAKVEDSSRFIVNIGASSASEKSYEDMQRLLEHQSKELAGYQQQLQALHDETENRLFHTQKSASKILKAHDKEVS
ncbi:prefoldin subunit alpha [Candidatus Woesearchaeota archaeon]|nr:prefoldin subunit alpha [Candidatus Woesearchaeota archaeon]